MNYLAYRIAVIASMLIILAPSSSFLPSTSLLPRLLTSLNVKTTTKLIPPSKLLHHLRSLPITPSNPLLPFEEYDRHFSAKGYKENGRLNARRRGGGVDREVICLNVILDRTSRLPPSLSVYSRGKSLFLSSLPISLNEYTVSSYLKFVLRHSPAPPEDALEVSEALVKREWKNVRFNGVLLSLVMNVLSKHYQRHPAKADFATMKGTLSSLLPLLPNPQDGVVGFNVLLNFAVHRNDGEAVVKVRERMRDKGVKKDKVTVSTIAMHLLKSKPGDMKEQVQGLAREIAENGVRMDEELGMMLVSLTMFYGPGEGGGGGAKEFVAFMEGEEMGVTDTTRGVVVESMCRGGEMQEAIEYYR